MAKQRFLNLGCGPDYRVSDEYNEWVNVDNGMCRCDVSIDIEHARDYPSWGTFDRIEAIQVLEHISKDKFAEVIQWMYDVSNDGAIWYIASPHGFSENFITDPTHKMPFSVRTFDYFVDGTPLRELGVIYGWGRVKLEYLTTPYIDEHYSVIFQLRVKK
jgi:hypothetical protein